MYTKLRLLRRFNSGLFTKSGHKYFEGSGPFLQISSHILLYTHVAIYSTGCYYHIG